MQDFKYWLSLVVAVIFSITEAETKQVPCTSPSLPWALLRVPTNQSLSCCSLPRLPVYKELRSDRLRANWENDVLLPPKIQNAMFIFYYIYDFCPKGYADDQASTRRQYDGANKDQRSNKTCSCYAFLNRCCSVVFLPDGPRCKVRRWTLSESLALHLVQRYVSLVIICAFDFSALKCGEWLRDWHLSNLKNVMRASQSGGQD